MNSDYCVKLHENDDVYGVKVSQDANESDWENSRVAWNGKN